MKMYKNLKYLILILALFFFPMGKTFAISTPAFTFDLGPGTTGQYTVSDNYVFNGSIKVKNLDSSRWVRLRFTGNFNNEESFATFGNNDILLNPFQESSVNFQFSIHDDYCSGDYDLKLRTTLINYGGEANSGASTGVSAGVAIGNIIRFAVQSDTLCGRTGGNVFNDLDGDGLYEPSNGEGLISLGSSYFYDSNNVLLTTGDLALKLGRYTLPDGGFQGVKSFYITTNTSKYAGTILDKTWVGNFYVNRTGTFNSIQSAFLATNISNYTQITSDIPLRSRNLDRVGTWGQGNMSIGPDDKDQIISPSRWDLPVANTNFMYADLDYDGRIDPDDKDNIISPLYWDFPN